VTEQRCQQHARTKPFKSHKAKSIVEVKRVIKWKRHYLLQKKQKKKKKRKEKDD